MKGASWAHVQQALSDLAFPATKDEIVAHAMDKEDAAAIRLLEALPQATYQSISEVRGSVKSDSDADSERISQGSRTIGP